MLLFQMEPYLYQLMCLPFTQTLTIMRVYQLVNNSLILAAIQSPLLTTLSDFWKRCSNSTQMSLITHSTVRFLASAWVLVVHPLSPTSSWARLKETSYPQHILLLKAPGNATSTTYILYGLTVLTLSRISKLT